MFESMASPNLFLKTSGTGFSQKRSTIFSVEAGEGSRKEGELELSVSYGEHNHNYAVDWLGCTTLCFCYGDFS